MPFDVGFGELVVIGIVALIVIGPKDLPNLFRSVGRFTGRMRAMADDFRRTLESAADDAGVNDIRKDFNNFSDYAKNNSGVNEANQTIRDINSTRVYDIDDDASELEADLAENKIVNKEIAKAKAAKAKAVKAESAKVKAAKAKAEPKKAAPDKTITAAKKPAAKKTSSKEKA